MRAARRPRHYPRGVAEADWLEGVALVTGGGRGIGARIARELAGAGMRVAVSARSEQVEDVAREDGVAVVADVSRPDEVERMVAETEAALGPVDLLSANAGIGLRGGDPWETPVEEWWHVFEVNVLGRHLPRSSRACSNAVAAAS